MHCKATLKQMMGNESRTNIDNLDSGERRGNSGPKSLCFANYYIPVYNS